MRACLAVVCMCVPVRPSLQENALILTVVCVPARVYRYYLLYVHVMIRFLMGALGVEEG